MTTFTGSWGTAVVYGGDLLPLDVDDLERGVLALPNCSPLMEWFFAGAPAEDVLIVPSWWGTPWQRAYAELCQSAAPVRPTWQVVRDWMEFDARSCPPRYIALVELTAQNLVVSMVNYWSNSLEYQDMFPGMGCAAGAYDSEEWRYAVSSTVRLIIDKFHDDTDVIVAGEETGQRAELGQLLCETLIGAGIMSYRITPQDVGELLTDQAHMEEVKHRVAEREEALRNPPRKRWPAIVGSLAGVVVLLVVGCVVISQVVAHKDTAMADPVVVVTNQPVVEAEESVTLQLGRWLSFPGGKLRMPPGWVVDPAESEDIGQARNDGSLATVWKRVLTVKSEPQMRILVTLQTDIEHSLANQLAEELQDPASIYRAWPNPYAGQSLTLKYPVALSYQEISGKISRAEWVVIYNEDTALSFGCQYRMKEGMGQTKAFEKCAPILSSVTFKKVL